MVDSTRNQFNIDWPFDLDWYRLQSGIDFKSIFLASNHFLSEGWRRNISPHPIFDIKYYLHQRPDLIGNKKSPFLHFCEYGWQEGCSPHPLFDVDFYLRQFHSFPREFRDPLSHYLNIGWKAGFRPNSHFDPLWYLANNPDVASSNREPLTHYIEAGQNENRAPRDMSQPPAEPQIVELKSLVSRPAAMHVIRHAREFQPTPYRGPIDLSRFCEPLDLNMSMTASPGTVIGVFIHIYYEELAEEMCARILHIPFPVRIFVTTDTHQKAQAIRNTFLRFGFESRIFDIRVSKNRGFDLGPFITEFADVFDELDICVRLHTKRSSHNAEEFGRRWREYLYDQNLANESRVRAIVGAMFNQPDIGVLVPSHWDPIKPWISVGDNLKPMQRLLSKIDVTISKDEQIQYPSGSMFWFRGKALRALTALKLDIMSFEANSKRDGTLAHALERALLFFAIRSGFKWAHLPRFEGGISLSTSEAIDTIRKSGLFDKSYYSSTYPDVSKNGGDLIEHYVRWGAAEGRNPADWFDTKYYSRSMQADRPGSIDPFAHYVVRGRALGLPTQRMDRVPATTRVDDLYAGYRKAEESPEYERETFPIFRKTDLRALAFYFPQFHPFAENNKFWGRGFTEWTNTTKSIPMFRGHYQPRLPGELGFYDTRLKEVLQRQIELAKQYGIHGFCFHHYFFSGKPVMRAPYDIILANPDLDIPFCLHWANEPWTVRWDGLANQKGVLLAQSHSPEDDFAFFRDIEPALRDRRYIRVDGRPVLVIYRPSLFPNMADTIKRWRKLCKEAGIGDLYLVVMHTGFEAPVDPSKYGFDAAIEYPPHHLGVKPVNERLSWFDPAYEGNAFDYAETVEKALNRKMPKYRLFRGIMPEWDCTPRRRNPDLFINCAPHRYQGWLEGIGRQTVTNYPPQEQFIFINAWNEWAEGAYLEPDRKFGYAYLGATARALNNVSGAPRLKQAPKILLGTHLFYTDLVSEFAEQFRHVPAGFDLYVTTPHERVEALRAELQDLLGDHAGLITVVGVDNFGRDFAPFILQFLPQTSRYDLCCWTHSKKSQYEPTYGDWRSYLLENLFGSPGQVSAILEHFEDDPKLGVMSPHAFHAVAGKVEWGSNFKLTAQLLKRIEIEITEDMQPEFPTAAMFWFRPAALAGLLDLKLTRADFEAHAEGPRDAKTGMIVDGTISHALERMIVYVQRKAGYGHLEYSFKA
ncbi:MAG: hypothetical protein CFE31_19385 [Rhizobiales bacterium PAR1]|nr:MAG: hypothetical protein CFE31_19385 [Rhizobiales bacterium PAR1]